MQGATRGVFQSTQKLAGAPLAESDKGGDIFALNNFIDGRAQPLVDGVEDLLPQRRW